jgi:Ca-activated chloride channel family protein
MSFQMPVALYLLVPVSMLALAYVWMHSRRRRYAISYSQVALVQGATGASSRWRRHLPAVLVVLAMSTMVVGLARPEATLTTPQQTGTVIIALDASGSMSTSDVKPTRIDAARAAVRSFVQKQPKNVKVGVVGFAGFASVVVPPTRDRKQVIGAVSTISLARGTNVGDGLQVALNALLEAEQSDEVAVFPADAGERRAANPEAQVIILLSDGASTTGPSPLVVADKVAQAGVKVYTVGMGVRSGQAGGLSFGGGRFMELDEPVLKGIAEKTGGKYFTAQNSGELTRVYNDLALLTRFDAARDELTFLASGAAALLLIAGGVLGLLWSSRIP